MRIVQLLPAMHVGGVERGVVELSRTLVANGDESIVISRHGALVPDITNAGGQHIPFDSGGKNPLTVLARARRLRALLADIAPDIVHVRSRVPAWLLHFAGGTHATVSTFHGIYTIGKYSARMTKSDIVICPSSAVVAHIRQHYNTPQEKLRLIHRGVDRDYFDPAHIDTEWCKQWRAQHRLDGHTVFAMIARVTGWKGHTLFLQAFARAAAAGGFAKPPLALIVGADNGKRSNALRQLAKTLNIEVRFTGVERQMREVYACCDIVVSASTDPEAFGRTVAEALTMERPVVAPAHGGALDIVQNNKNGALFTPGNTDALTAALTRAATLPREGLRDSVATFTLTNMTEKTRAVYKELCQNGAPRAR